MKDFDMASAMSHPKVQALGIAYCRREDYARFRQIMADKHLLAERWEQFDEGTQRTKRKYEALGKRVVLAVIDPEQFPAWCALRGHRVDSQARIAFAAECAMRAISKEN